MSNFTPVVQLKTVPTRLALEYAFAAYRVNGGYVKEPSLSNGPEFNNRNLVEHCVKHWINETQNESTLVFWIPYEFNVLEITEQDRASADQVDQHFKKYMFNSLAGKLSQFENDIYSTICSEEVAITKVGLIAYIPELVDRDRAKWQFEKTVNTEYKHSSFQTVESVEGKMTVLRVYDFTTSDFDTVRNVILGFDGNLYHFYDKKRYVALKSEGCKYYVKGRVKAEAKERNTGATMTRLNYVKAKLCQSQ
jgi:hypothetical protein